MPYAVNWFEKLKKEKEGCYVSAGDVLSDVYRMICEGSAFVPESSVSAYSLNQGVILKQLMGKSHSMRSNYSLSKLLELQVCLKDRSLGFKDGLIKPHNSHVEVYSEAICRSLGYGSFKTERIARSGEFHDIGKIAVPDIVLNKPSALTEDERNNFIRPHPETGASMLSLLGKLFDEDLDDIIANVRYHHEWYSGRGYPCGLSGADTPLGAQVVAVADVFDALTSRRPYKEPVSAEHALDIMASEEGHFNPDLLEHSKSPLTKTFSRIHS